MGGLNSHLPCDVGPRGRWPAGSVRIPGAGSCGREQSPAIILRLPVEAAVPPLLAVRLQPLTWSRGVGALVLVVVCCAVSLSLRDALPGLGSRLASGSTVNTHTQAWDRLLLCF